MRPPTRDDFEDSVAMWGDPIVVRHIGYKPFTREATWARLLRYVGHWQLLGYGMWTVRERATGAFVGEVGLLEAMREISPPLDAPELGWVLAKHAHGKGYATEAVHAALAWGRRLGDRFTAIIDPDNAPSLRVAEKCGFREVRRPTYNDESIVVMELRLAT